MPYQRPAYEQVTISHGGSTLQLRPSLRAATTLVNRHGLPALYSAVDECHLTIIHEIILTASTSHRDASEFISGTAGKPLQPFFIAARQPLADLLGMFIPVFDKSPKQDAGKPMSWSRFYRDLYRNACGPLEWTPDVAWNATPTEILEAWTGRFVPYAQWSNPDQAAVNAAEGLDPEFDRESFQALKAAIAGA